jgi:hypothetical protein
MEAPFNLRFDIGTVFSPNSERDFSMSCAVKSSFKTGLQCPVFKQIWNVGKVGKVGKVDKVGKVGRVGKEGKEGWLRE